jgi:DNA-binding MarR family transcriptional regulator
MDVNVEQGNIVLRLWLLLRRVGDTVARCQDSVFSRYGLTSEQLQVLASIKSRGPLRPSDLASILERTPNSMSMLIDRMVKAGLVRRTRDRKDRRVVTVSLTEKGKTAVEPAVPAGWEFAHEVLSTLSDDEQRDLASLLERVKCELDSHLDPERDKAEILRKSFTNDPDLYKRMVKNLLPLGFETRDRAGQNWTKHCR